MVTDNFMVSILFVTCLPLGLTRFLSGVFQHGKTCQAINRLNSCFPQTKEHGFAVAQILPPMAHYQRSNATGELPLLVKVIWAFPFSPPSSVYHADLPGLHFSYVLTKSLFRHYWINIRFTSLLTKGLPDNLKHWFLKMSAYNEVRDRNPDSLGRTHLLLCWCWRISSVFSSFMPKIFGRYPSEGQNSSFKTGSAGLLFLCTY